MTVKPGSELKAKLHFLDNVIEAIALIDSDRNVLYANEAFAKMAEVPLRKVKSTESIGSFLDFDSEWLRSLPPAAELDEPTPYKNFTVKSVNGGTEVLAQISAQGYPEIPGSYMIFILDISLEDRLHKKFKRELSEKEGVINNLNRKVFEVGFLFQLGEIINSSIHLKEELPIVMEKVCALIYSVFKFESVSFQSAMNSARGDVILKAAAKETSVETQEFMIWNAPQEEQLNSLEGKYIGCFETASKRHFVIPLLLSKKRNVAVVASLPKNDSHLHKEDENILSIAGKQISVLFESQDLYQKSITDEMTGLYNKRQFNQYFEKQIEKSKVLGQGFGLLVMDIDFFKKFNDTHGHAVGDSVLKHVASCLRAACRTGDLLARYGGEEFVVVSQAQDVDTIKLIGERIRQKVESTIYNDPVKGPLKVTISIGASIFDPQVSTAEGMFELADGALYAAKKAGRNNVQVKLEGDAIESKPA